MTIAQVKDWLKEHIDGATWATGSLRSSAEKTIVVLNGRAYTNPTAIGQPSSYHGKGVRVLIHWNRSTIDSELKAQEVYNFLHAQPNPIIGGKKVYQIKMYDPEPVSLGPDPNGIYEFIVDAEFIIQR